jgi:prepilin-type processing-associated H-X9-DG protein
VWAILETYYHISPNSTVCVCPQVLMDHGPPPVTVPGNAAIEAVYPNAIFSYRYNEILGGMQVPGVAPYATNWGGYEPTGQGPIYKATTAGNYWFSRPWKLGNIATPTQAALLIEDKTTYWKPSYDWANNLNTYFNLNWVTDSTAAPYAGHQQLYGVGVAHNAKYQNGYNPDGSPCAVGTGNVLYADGSVQSQVYHQGTAGVNAPPKNGLGFIDGTAADPDYAP